MSKKNQTPKAVTGVPAVKKGPTNPAVTKAKDIKDNVAEASALVVAKPLSGLATTYKQAMAQAKDHIGFGLQAYTAAIAMKDLQPIEVISLHDYGASALDALEEAKKIARARVLDLTLSQGQATGEKGLSRELNIDGHVQKVTIQKSGVDPKLFEAGLRAKGATVSKYMETVVTYKHSTTGVQAAVDDGIFTADELKAMEYQPTYRVERSKEVGNE